MLAEERALLERAQRRDVAAFEELVRPFEDRLFRLILAVAGNREDAEDSLQEALVRAYKALPAFRGDSTLATWLTRIALNTTRNWLRTQSRASAQRTFEHAPLCAAPANEDPVDCLLEEENQTLIRRALLALPEHYRAALVMRHYQDMSYLDIADALQIPIGTVRSRLAQARALLLRKLSAAGYTVHPDKR
jgi:RNA polymerase sigma-70 factor (ECF subfamily)